MIIEAQNKEFFLENPNNVHFAPFRQNEPSGEYIVISDSYSCTLLLGKYKDRIRAAEVYEEIKRLTIANEKFFPMPRE